MRRCITQALPVNHHAPHVGTFTAFVRWCAQGENGYPYRVNRGAALPVAGDCLHLVGNMWEAAPYDRSSPFLTPEQISALVPDADGQTSIHFYVSIPGLGHRVFKGKGCGVRNATAAEWLEVFKREHPGCTVLASPHDLGDRINADGTLYAD